MGAVVDCEFPVGSLRADERLRIDQAADKNFGTPETHLTLGLRCTSARTGFGPWPCLPQHGLMRGMKVNDTGKPISCRFARKYLAAL